MILLCVDTAATLIHRTTDISEELRRKPHGGCQADDSLTTYHVQNGLVSGVAMTTGLC